MSGDSVGGVWSKVLNYMMLLACLFCLVGGGGGGGGGWRRIGWEGRMVEV